ncbi:hypothetical protein LCGC14_3125450 [marine sediment metagenome]|uniref:Uncharacterized protein n=1 Tax=marine sediment metagenome TaxID=412755 RepID=A0A0F8W137_9ZZZZ
MVGVLDSMVIPDDLLTIEQALSDFNADLIVIDTLSDFVNCNVLGNQAVRKALLPLRELALLQVLKPNIAPYLKGVKER